ncbi:MAG: acyl-CoA thioesterase [Alistipes sp.]|nr:acyl-CoA thioesterase [Alistipes sp.]
MITADVKYRVIYRDTDKMGVVYHANYIALYEIARNEMFRELGIPYTDLEKMGVMMPVVEVESKYKSPAYYDDLLTIRATIKELPVAKLDVEYEVFNEQGTLLNTGRTVLGYVNMERLRPCRAPQELIERLSEYFQQ